MAVQIDMSRIQKLLFIILCAGLATSPAFSQTNIFSCGPAGTAWSATSGACWADQTYLGRPFAFNGNTPPAISGNSVVLTQGTDTHNAGNMNYAVGTVSTQGFTSSFTFVPDGYNIAFVLQNNTNTGAAPSGAFFTAGAFCEGGYFQGFSPPPNNVFSLNLDSQNNLDTSGTYPGNFTYSSAQIYMGGQTPCIPNDAQTSWFPSTKISTSPVPLNNPSSTSETTTGDTYQAMIGYDGSNVSLCLYDITAAAGSCSSSTSGTGTFFQHTWTNISIPAWTNGIAAWVGLSTSTGNPLGNVLTVYNWSFNTKSPTATPGSSAPVNGGTYATNPTLSPAAGSYTSAQTITVTPPSGGYACYAVGSPGVVVTPFPDNRNGCNTASTKYTSPIVISATQTLYVISGFDDTSCPGSCPATNLPSGLVTATYTISGGGSGNPPVSLGQKASLSGKAQAQ